MTRRPLPTIWIVGLLVLMAASFRWPSFGTVFLCTTLVLLGVANALLTIQSKQLGVMTGGSAAALALATTAGAGLSPSLVLVLTAFGAVAGFGFAAFPVSLSESSDSDDCPLNEKSGGGGDFGGGGADGRY